MNAGANAALPDRATTRYPAFLTHLTAQGTLLPGLMQREFDDHLKCGRLEHGFRRVRFGN